MADRWKTGEMIQSVAGWLAGVAIAGAVVTPVARMATGEAVHLSPIAIQICAGLLPLAVWLSLRNGRLKQAGVLAVLNAVALVAAALLMISLSMLAADRGPGPVFWIALSILFTLALAGFWLWAARAISRQRAKLEGAAL